MSHLGSSQTSNLPGIVYDQPELYESEPIVEDTTPGNDHDQTIENESIALIEIPIKQAFSYFAERENQIAQFYVQRHGEYKISSGPADEESEIEKYHRLVSEVNQLLSRFQAEKNGSSSGSELSAIGALDHSKLCNNLEILSRQLKSIEYAAQDGTLDPIQMQCGQIESKLENLSVNVDQADVAANVVTSNTRTKEIMKLAGIEKRISQLENILGSDDSKAQNLCKLTNCQSLVESVSQMAQYTSYLRPENIHRAKKDIEFLTQKLETLENQYSSDLDQLEPNSRAKLNQLFELLASTNKHRAMMPTLVQRLNAMEELQSRASEIANTVNHLELVQSQIIETLQSNKGDLTSVREMFKKNMELIKEYSQNIDTKLRNFQGQL